MKTLMKTFVSEKINSKLHSSGFISSCSQLAKPHVSPKMWNDFFWDLMRHVKLLEYQSNSCLPETLN